MSAVEQDMEEKILDQDNNEQQEQPNNNSVDNNSNEKEEEQQQEIKLDNNDNSNDNSNEKEEQQQEANLKEEEEEQQQQQEINLEEEEEEEEEQEIKLDNNNNNNEKEEEEEDEEIKLEGNSKNQEKPNQSWWSQTNFNPSNWFNTSKAPEQKDNEEEEEEEQIDENKTVDTRNQVATKLIDAVTNKFGEQFPEQHIPFSDNINNDGKLPNIENTGGGLCSAPAFTLFKSEPNNKKTDKKHAQALDKQLKAIEGKPGALNLVWKAMLDFYANSKSGVNGHYDKPKNSEEPDQLTFKAQLLTVLHIHNYAPGNLDDFGNFDESANAVNELEFDKSGHKVTNQKALLAEMTTYLKDTYGYGSDAVDKAEVEANNNNNNN